MQFWNTVKICQNKIPASDQSCKRANKFRPEPGPNSKYKPEPEDYFEAQIMPEKTRKLS